MNNPRNWRTHRFAPLSDLTGTEGWQAGVPAHLSAQMQASMAEGFQQGMDRGYREGHESGVRGGFDAGRAQGRDQGLREGAEEARREVLTRFESLARPIEAMLQTLQGLQEDYQSALRKEVVDLVARVAREVIRCELVLQPSQLLTLVDEALATMPGAPVDRIEVYLNDKDIERIREIDPGRADQWNLIADPRLDSGECRVKAGEREADAGCKQRLAACMEQVATQLLPDAGAAEVAA